MEGKQGKTVIRSVVCIAAAALFALTMLWLPSSPVRAGKDVAAPTPTPRRASKKTTPRTVKYSQFPHNAKAHQVECSTCHKFPSPNWNKVRTGPDAFADITEYPTHNSCIKCHTQQFFKGARPAICSICHTNPSPRDGTRHPFPNPREIFDLSAKGKTAESDFVIGFPHDKHIEIVSSHSQDRTPFINASFERPERRLAAEESCAVCHKTMQPQGDGAVEYVTPPPANIGDGYWLKKGTFKTTPIGHTTCFTCHMADSGMLPEPQNCGTCHKLKPPQPVSDLDPQFAATVGVADKVMMDAWKRRDSAGTFRHEWFSHAELSCSTCHNVQTINTADPATKKVSISSCAMCHATATADEGGALNFEMESRKTNPTFQCVKCHIGFGKLPVPASHVKALSEATGK
jgi:hypothetical protein